MLFDLRGPGRRRTVKVIYITLALLMGGGLVLFGIGGAALRRPVRRDHRQQRRRRHAAPTRFEKRGRGRREDASANPQDAARMGRARPRPLPGRRRRATTSTRRTATYTAGGKRQLARAGDAWDKLPRARPEEARRPRRQPDGPGLPGAQRARQGRRRPGDRHRGQPDAGASRTLAIYAYQAGQTRKGDLAAAKALDLATQGRARRSRASSTQAKQQAARSSSSRPRRRRRRPPTPEQSRYNAAPRPCSSTGRAADS